MYLPTLHVAIAIDKTLFRIPHIRHFRQKHRIPYTVYFALPAHYKTPYVRFTMSIWAVYGIPYIVCVPGRAPAISTQEYGTIYGLLYYGIIYGRIYGMYK